MFKKNLIIDCNNKSDSEKIIDLYLKDGYSFKNMLINDDIKSNSLCIVVHRFKEIELFQNIENFKSLLKERETKDYSRFIEYNANIVLKSFNWIIKDLDKKLKGEYPVSREELFKLINTHGRNDSFLTYDDIKIIKCEPKECYDLSNLDVSEINNLSEIFKYSMYNGDISFWNTSKTTNMAMMFAVSKFNNNSLNSWNISSVKNINAIFKNSEFAGDISSWKFNKSIDCYQMFNGNKNFENKYNYGEPIPEFKKEFLEWFKYKKSLIKETNINVKIEDNKNTLDLFLKEKGIDKYKITNKKENVETYINCVYEKYKDIFD